MAFLENFHLYYPLSMPLQNVRFKISPNLTVYIDNLQENTQIIVTMKIVRKLKAAGPGG